jgi:hypothetical protein
MFTLRQAKKQAAQLSAMHGKPWLVFKTPTNGMCNQHPYNIYNAGVYACCDADDRDDYASGGAEFVA